MEDWSICIHMQSMASASRRLPPRSEGFSIGGAPGSVLLTPSANTNTGLSSGMSSMRSVNARGSLCVCVCVCVCVSVCV